MVWVDQPIGTGLSFLSNLTAQQGSYARTRPRLQGDFLAFVEAFYSAYPFFASHHRVILAGESYAGVYLPLFAQALLDGGYPLGGVLVGDPFIDAWDAAAGSLLAARLYQFVSPQEYELLDKALMPSCRDGMLEGNATQARSRKRKAAQVITPLSRSRSSYFSLSRSLSRCCVQICRSPLLSSWCFCAVTHPFAPLHFGRQHRCAGVDVRHHHGSALLPNLPVAVV